MRSWTNFCAFMLSAMTLIAVAGCGGATTVTPPPTTFAISGSVTGYTGTGLVLQDNLGNDLDISGNGSFTFSNAISSGGGYSVTVLTQPTGQTCSVSNGSGTATANVTNVAVTCKANTYTIGGTVTGLNGTGLVLQDNLGNNLAVSGSSFTFTTAIASGGGYSVTVLTQPTGQTCSVSNGSGTATANVTNVAVTCKANTYTIGGTVTGLNGTGLVLTTNGINLPVSGNGAFTFTTPISYGVSYSVAVGMEPTGQTCTVSNGSGTATANVTNVAVTCTANTYTISGTITGLTASMGLSDTITSYTVIANATTFNFTGVAYGSTYDVYPYSQPTGQFCSVSNGVGTVTGNVTNVTIACTNTYTIGGTVTGLSSTGLVLT